MAVKKANPMQTRTGKPRLGPLNVTQLTALLEKTQQKKNKAKIKLKAKKNIAIFCIKEFVKKNLKRIIF